MLLHDAVPRAIGWYDMARNEGLGVNRKADLYDIREALKSKGLVRQYGDRWNAC